MSRGESTCKVLKEVRRKIADANGIPLEERECTHKGDCAGTCPYCEGASVLPEDFAVGDATQSVFMYFCTFNNHHHYGRH